MCEFWLQHSAHHLNAFHLLLISLPTKQSFNFHTHRPKCPPTSFHTHAAHGKTLREVSPCRELAFPAKDIQFDYRTNSRLNSLIPIQMRKRQGITACRQRATLSLRYCRQMHFAMFPIPSFKTNSCLFQNIQYFAFAIHSIMTFTHFKAIKPTKEAKHRPDDDSFSPQGLISHDSENPLSYPLCTHLQQKALQHTPKKRRNVRLQLRMEPSDEKMRRIGERRGGYKRSTNNSHKKFICVAKRLLLRLLEQPQRLEFEQNYEAFKNSRTYYFIILSYAKLLLPPLRLQAFRGQFRTLMENKIAYYQKEIDRTDNRNFINFRSDEMADIQFALSALELYLEDRVEAAIEIIYKRDRTEVLKKQQFEQAVQVARKVEEKLKASNGHRQRQSVIILQHNAEQLKQEEKEVEQEEEKEEPNQIYPFANFEQEQPRPFMAGAHPSSSFSRTDGVVMEEGQQKMPLLFLENSYPYYSYFTDIVFPYEAQMQHLHTPPYQYTWCGQPGKTFEWGADVYLPLAEQVEEGAKVDLFVGKTAVEEEWAMRNQ